MKENTPEDGFMSRKRRQEVDATSDEAGRKLAARILYTRVSLLWLSRPCPKCPKIWARVGIPRYLPGYSFCPHISGKEMKLSKKVPLTFGHFLSRVWAKRECRRHFCPKRQKILRPYTYLTKRTYCAPSFSLPTIPAPCPDHSLPSTRGDFFRRVWSVKARAGTLWLCKWWVGLLEHLGRRVETA